MSRLAESLPKEKAEHLYGRRPLSDNIARRVGSNRKSIRKPLKRFEIELGRSGHAGRHA